MIRPSSKSVCSKLEFISFFRYVIHNFELLGWLTMDSPSDSRYFLPVSRVLFLFSFSRLRFLFPVLHSLFSVLLSPFSFLRPPACSTCFIVPYMALFHVLTTGRWVCFLRISRELWVGVNRSEVAKLLNQGNKSWVDKEAWYSSLTFSTKVKNCLLSQPISIQ